MSEINLVPAIHEIERAIQKMELDFDKRIKPYRDSLTQLQKINKTCERCCGEKRILRSRSCAEDDRPDPNDPSDYITCPECDGSGLANYGNKDIQPV